MKNIIALNLAAIALTLACCLPFTGNAQTYEYQVTTPIDGWFQQGAADPGEQWIGIGHIFDFGTLCETLFYNPTQNTLRQVGSFTVSSTSFSGSWEDDKVVSGALVPATVSVDYILNNGNNTVSFDSGVESLSGNQTPNPAFTWSIPFSESITVTTGGQDYQCLIAGIVPGGYTMTTVSDFTPSSIVISQGNQEFEDIGEQYYVDITAANGWSAEIFDGIGDGFLGEGWYVGPVTATAVVPETSIFGLAAGSVSLVVAGVSSIRRVRKFTIA